MATKKINYDNPDVIEGDFDDVSELQEDLDQELNSIFSEFGGDDALDEYKIRVYRVQEGKGELGYLFACLPSELPILDRLRDEYSGGTFEVRILKNNKIFRRRKTVIEPPLKKNLNAAGAKSSDMMAVVQAMNNGFVRLGELIAQNNSPINPVAMQSELLTNMVAMKELLGGSGKTESPVGMLKEMFELQKMFGFADGGSSSTDVLMSMANQVLPKLAEMGSSTSPPRQKNIRRRLKSNKRPELSHEKGKSENPMKMHLIFLCAQAAANNSPETYAKMVIDHTDTNKIDDLKEFMSGDDALQRMGQIHKSVLKHPQWFADLRMHIMKLLKVNAVVDNVAPIISDGVHGLVGNQNIDIKQAKSTAN